MLRYSSRLIASLALGLTGGVVLLADGAQTGTLVGVVKDDKGMPIPGAAVRITGSTLMGERLLTTSAAGSFRAPSLPPGTAYEVTVVAEGYQTAKVPARVGVNQVFQMTVALQPIAASVVEVVAVGSSIDTTTVSSPTNMNREMIDNLPIARSYQNIMALTPGLVGDGNPLALGGNERENLYLLDGVDTTDATSGTFSMNLNQEAVEEIQVLTTGLSAEYGRFGGAIANVVTKSGGNTFEGAVRYDFYNLSWDSKGKLTERPKSKLVGSPYLTIGGPILKDKLWFFITAQSQKDETRESTFFGHEYTREFKSDPVAYSAKVTWQINPNHSLVLQTTGDPTYIKNDYTQTYTAGDIAAHGNQLQEVKFASLTYRAIPRPDLTFDIKLARHDHRIDYTSNSGSTPGVYEEQFNTWWENIPAETFIKRTRSQLNASISYYLNTHEIKSGFDYQKTHSSIQDSMPGGSVLSFKNDGSAPSDFSLIVQKESVKKESDQNYLAFYLNDRWRLGNGLSANIGLRVEKFVGKTDLGTTIWDYTGISPRLGLTYDWKDNGRQSIGANVARYTILPKQVILDDLSESHNTNWIYTGYDGQGNKFDPERYNPPVVQSHLTHSFQGDLKASYLDELVVSAKFQIGTNWIFATQGVARDYRDPIFIYRFYNETSPNDNKLKLYADLRNAKNAKREYRALITSLDYQNGPWFMRMSYTHSSLNANYDSSDHNNLYGFMQEGDYIPHPEWNDNRVWGRMGYDQPHAFQLFASHRFDIGNWGFSQGITFFCKSGGVWNLAAKYIDENADPVVISDQNNFFYITENGKRGDHKFPTNYRLHYNLNTAYRFTQRVSLHIGLDVFNILNTFKKEYYNTEGELKENPSGKPFVVPSAQYFGRAGSLDYTPGRAFRFTTSLRF